MKVIVTDMYDRFANRLIKDNLSDADAELLAREMNCDNRDPEFWYVAVEDDREAGRTIYVLREILRALLADRDRLVRELAYAHDRQERELEAHKHKNVC